MKNLGVYLVIFVILLSCKKAEIVIDNNLVGKWRHTYFVQQKDQNGNWGEWTQINTLVALPTLEFIANGKIFYDGKFKEADCCFDTFTDFQIKNNELFMSYKEKTKLDCSIIDFICLEKNNNWQFEIIKNDTLILTQCKTRNKFIRIQ